MSNDARQYRVFVRTWWKRNRDWPNGLEPCAGRRNYTGHPQRCTIEQARDYCRTYNANHDPGPLSRKAEFEER